MSSYSFNTTPQPVGKVTGVLAPNNPMGVGTSAQNLAQAPKPQTMVTPGSTVGLLPNHTLKSDAAGNTYSAPKSNPSVLAQQQALNAQGAGLVEDGIAGPLTSAAIAKYGTGSSTGSSSSSTPSPIYSTADGHKLLPGEAPNSIAQPATPSTPTTPQVGNTSTNAQTLLNSGNQTPLESQTYQGLLAYGQGQESPEVTKARQDLLDAQNQFAQQTSDINQSGTWTSRAEGEQGQANIQNSNTLANLQGALSNAMTSQGQQIGALGTANGAAQTTASRGTSTAGTVLDASLNSPTTPGQATFNSLSGYQGTGANGNVTINQFGDPNDPATASKYQAYMDYYNKYNAGLGGINQAAAIEPTILSTITSNPQLNNQPISAITDLNQFLSGQTSQPGQQQLSTQVAAYIKNLGIDPATLSANIASQQSGTLIQLLSNLKNLAVKNNNALKTTADSLKTGNSGSATGGGFTEGQKSSDGSLVYKNGKWTKA